MKRNLSKLPSRGALLMLVAATALAAGERSVVQTLDGNQGQPLVPYLSTNQLLMTNPALRDLILSPPANAQSLAGKRVAVLTTDGVEEIELLASLNFLRARGARADVVAPRMPQIDPRLGVRYPAQRASHILTARFVQVGTWVKIDRFLDEVKADDYEAVVIGGGAWNPDSLRIDPSALSFVRNLSGQGKLVAAICHGPLVLVNAGLLRGKRATSTWNVQLDLKNAGATVLDVPVVTDGNLVTSRHPIDLPAFLGTIEEKLRGARS